MKLPYDLRCQVCSRTSDNMMKPSDMVWGLLIPVDLLENVLEDLLDE